MKRGPDGEHRFRDAQDAVEWLESQGFRFSRDGNPSHWYTHGGEHAKLFLADKPDDDHLVYIS